MLPANKERRERWLQAIMCDKREPKASDRICRSHFVGNRPSKDPKDVNYVPTLCGNRKRRVNTSNVDHDQLERTAK